MTKSHPFKVYSHEHDRKSISTDTRWEPSQDLKNGYVAEETCGEKMRKVERITKFQCKKIVTKKQTERK